MTNNELKLFRGRLKISQFELASLAGIALRSYQDLEGGFSKIPPIHVLAFERVAEKLAVKFGDPMMAPEQVRADALDLAKLIRGS